MSQLSNTECSRYSMPRNVKCFGCHDQKLAGLCSYRETPCHGKSDPPGRRITSITEEHQPDSLCLSFLLTNLLKNLTFLSCSKDLLNSYTLKRHSTQQTVSKASEGGGLKRVFLKPTTEQAWKKKKHSLGTLTHPPDCAQSNGNLLPPQHIGES